MKHEKILAAVSLGLLSAVTSTAFAADAPTLGSVLEASGITASGYVAASYYHSSGENTYHAFDTTHDTFQLDQASLSLAYQPKEGFGALAQVIAGEDSKLLPNSIATASGNSISVAQAYVQYAGGPVTVIAGKYFTLAGAEVVSIPSNTNFSRSLLFFFEPVTHTGVRATVAASDAYTFTVGVNNGWNYDKMNSTTTSGGNASMRTVEVGFTAAPVKMFSLAGSAYLGKDPHWEGDTTLFDLVATINATDNLSFVVSYDHGKQEYGSFYGFPDSKWDGVAAYANVKFTDQWRLSLRGEYMKLTQSGLSDVKLKEVTATVGYAPVSSFELRGEVRHDWSNKTDDAPEGYFFETSGLPTKKQTEFALQGVYHF